MGEAEREESRILDLVLMFLSGLVMGMAASWALDVLLMKEFCQ